MAYDLAKVTANGNNLIAQILANKSSLSIDKIEISDTQLPSTTDISTMTSVPKVVQTVSANGFSKNSNTLIISTVVDNSSISADYKAWVFGIWGSDSQNGQSQLIAVITSTNSPDTIPAFSGSTPVSYTYKFNIGFSNASQIQFNMIDDSFATNDTVVHTTGDETINGQKKFDTDPTDGAGNAYAKTVDVNQQLDKKVNIADMRKPASDVAGIEEVNAKQDKIGYTPSDDSKVVHTTDTSNWQKQKITNDDGTALVSIGDSDDLSAKISSFNTGFFTLYYSAKCANNPSTKAGRGFIEMTYYDKAYGSDGNGIIFDEDNVAFVVTVLNSNVTYSRLASLSGANNFDTVPTVNNNPLLLASSLPSDLARTGQANTFTAAQTFSIAPTITDASQDKGDNQAATMADLKSVENSAWRQLDCSSISTCAFNGIMLYKIDTTKKNIYFSLNDGSNEPTSNGVVNAGIKLLDFSSVVVNALSAHGYICSTYPTYGAIDSYVSRLQTSGAFVKSSDLIDISSGYKFASMGDSGQSFAYIEYDSLVNK